MVEPANEDATYMTANLMLMRDNFTEGAIKSYTELLENEPSNFNILANLIELLKRAGKISEIPTYIEQAENKTQRSKMAGLYYCKGLFGRYNSDP